MFAKVSLFRLDSRLECFSQLAAINHDETFLLQRLDVLSNVDVPLLQLLEKLTNWLNRVVLSLPSLEFEGLHEGVHIMTIFKGFRLFKQVLDRFDEALFDLGFRSLILETAVGNHLETRSSIGDETIDVRLQLLLSVDWLDIFGSLFHVSK